MGLVPGLGRFPGEKKGYPLQYSGLENSMNCIVHGIAKSWTRLSDFHFNHLVGLLLCPWTWVSFLFVCFKLPHNYMLKILQARLKQYVNWELPDVQVGFRKGRGSRDQIANIHWTTEKSREFQKNTYFCFIDYAEDFDCVDHKLWKILQDMGIPDHLTCLLRNLYAGQEATVRTGQRTMDWFQIKKGVHQGGILSSCLFKLYTEYLMQNARLDKAQAGIKIAGRNIKTSDMQMTPPLWQRVKRN